MKHKWITILAYCFSLSVASFQAQAVKIIYDFSGSISNDPQFPLPDIGTAFSGSITFDTATGSSDTLTSCGSGYIGDCEHKLYSYASMELTIGSHVLSADEIEIHVINGINGGSDQLSFNTTVDISGHYDTYIPVFNGNLNGWVIAGLGFGFSNESDPGTAVFDSTALPVAPDMLSLFPDQGGASLVLAPNSPCLLNPGSTEQPCFYEDALFFSFDTLTATVIPVPAAAWLFGSGLLLLVLNAKRGSRHG